ncbi:POPTR_0002s06550g [Fagus crenata]
MLLAVEGGGFFSSSASGYSKGLTLLLLGQKNEDKPMRVSPWNQYQLVDQSNPNLQLASTKNWLPRGCASFVCFGRASAGLDTPSPLKVGPAQQQDVLPGPLVSDKGKDCTADLDDNNAARKLALRSSLKQPFDKAPDSAGNANESQPLAENGNNIPGHTERRVQWTDACGSELVEIKEFEPSEADGSDDEFDNGNERSCSCAIM